QDSRTGTCGWFTCFLGRSQSRSFGGIAALRAPRLIARPIRFTPARWGGPEPARDAEADRDLARNTENRSSILVRRIAATLLGSRAQPPAWLDRATRNMAASPAGV